MRKRAILAAASLSAGAIGFGAQSSAEQPGGCENPVAVYFDDNGNEVDSFEDASTAISACPGVQLELDSIEKPAAAYEQAKRMQTSAQAATHFCISATYSSDKAEISVLCSLAEQQTP